MFFSYFYYLVSFVFSEFCNVCKKNNSSLGICAECWKDVDFISKNCQKCGCLVVCDVELCESCNIQNYTKSLANQDSSNQYNSSQHHASQGLSAGQCHINQSVTNYSANHSTAKVHDINLHSTNTASHYQYDQVNRNFSVFMYSGLGKKLMLQFKNGNYWNILPFFHTILSKNYLLNLIPQNIMNQIDFIIPVPLHKTRFFQRGYNQSHIVAKILSKSLNRECVQLLKRTKKTTPQEKMTLAERRRNVANAFDISTRFKIRKILDSKFSFLFSLLSSSRNMRSDRNVINVHDDGNVIGDVKSIENIQKSGCGKGSAEDREAGKNNTDKDIDIVGDATKGDIRGKNILIVDDVFTTGSTLNECAKTCKLHGANQIYTFTIANTYTSQRVINMLYKNLEKDNGKYD